MAHNVISSTLLSPWQMLLTLWILSAALLGCAAPISTHYIPENPGELRLTVQNDGMGLAKGEGFAQFGEDKPSEARAHLENIATCSKTAMHSVERGYKYFRQSSVLRLTGNLVSYIAPNASPIIMPLVAPITAAKTRNAWAETLNALHDHNSTPTCVSAQEQSGEKINPALAAGKLSWDIHRSLQIKQYGLVVATKKNTWKGLSAAVSTVPEAKKWADRAVQKSRSGKTIKITSSVLLAMTSIAAIAMSVTASLRDYGKEGPFDDPLFYAGLATAFGGRLALVLPLQIISKKRILQGDAAAIDAFYLYNDRVSHATGDK